eukprot:3447482-Amphidinium_carterae.2
MGCRSLEGVPRLLGDATEMPRLPLSEQSVRTPVASLQCHSPGRAVLNMLWRRWWSDCAALDISELPYRAMVSCAQAEVWMIFTDIKLILQESGVGKL